MSAPAQGASAVSFAGARAATTACDAAADILALPAEGRGSRTGAGISRVPEETRRALLDVPARAHAAAAKANAGSVAAVGARLDAAVEGDRLARLETFAGSTSIEAIKNHSIILSSR